MNPKVSIVVPNHNYSEYLPEAIESASRFYRQESEIIIVDDCSTDDSRQVIGELIEKYKEYNIMAIFNTENHGTAYTCNEGMKHSSGDYLLILSADDKLADGALRAMTDILDNQLDVDIVYGDVAYFGLQSGMANGGDFDVGRLKQSNYISATMLMRRKVWFEIGGYDENLKGSEDDDFLYSCIDKGFKFYYLPRAVLWYRKHEAQKMKRVDYNRNILKKIIMEKHKELFS